MKNCPIGINKLSKLVNFFAKFETNVKIARGVNNFDKATTFCQIWSHCSLLLFHWRWKFSLFLELIKEPATLTFVNLNFLLKNFCFFAPLSSFLFVQLSQDLNLYSNVNWERERDNLSHYHALSRSLNLVSELNLKQMKQSFILSSSGPVWPDG